MSESFRQHTESAYEPLEQSLMALEQYADRDIERYEQADSAYITNQKLLRGIGTEYDAEIEAIAEKYKKERRSFKAAFLARLKKVGAGVTGGVLALATTTHLAQKAFPDYLGGEEEPRVVQWNDNTRKEVHKLSVDYVEFAKKIDSRFKSSIPHGELQERFITFVEMYGPDIAIAHPGDDMATTDKAWEWVFQNVLQNQPNRAHYFDKTLFYGEDQVADTTRPAYSELSDFLAELAHHINNDWSWGRNAAYADDLINNGMQQKATYTDEYSVEYQAHSITEDAILKYLYPLDKEEYQYSFEDIYNKYFEYYREFVAISKELDDPDVVSWMDYRILDNRHLPFVMKNYRTIIERLQKIAVSIKVEGDTLNKTERYTIFREKTNEMMGDLYHTD